jgi:hypothetical protein
LYLQLIPLIFFLLEKSRNYPDWDLTVEFEKEIANILTTKGRVAEADEIRRRIKTLEETV